MEGEIEILAEIANKPYENRTSSQHRIMCRWLKQHFQTLTNKKIRLLSFFIVLIRGECTITSTDYPPESFVFFIGGNLPTSNPQPTVQRHTLTRNKYIITKDNNFALVVPYDKYLNVQTMGDSSIEEQLAFMHGSQLLCSMPRKKYYTLLRSGRILTYGEGQNIYFEGQSIESSCSGSGVYLVRSGQLGVYKNKGDKMVQTSRITPGQIVGSLEITSNPPSPFRIMTVKCKTEKSTLFHFSQDIFNKIIRPYCQNAISKRELKLTKFMPSNDGQQSNFAKTKSVSMSLKPAKINTNTSYSIKFNQTTSQLKSVSTLRESMFFKKSQQIQEEGLRKTNYFSLKNDGPLKNFPMTAQRSKYISSQFKDIDKKLFKNDPIPHLHLRISSRQQFIANIQKRDVMSQMMRKTFFDNLKRRSIQQ